MRADAQWISCGRTNWCCRWWSSTCPPNRPAGGYETIDTDPGHRVTRDADGSDAEEIAGRQHPAEARVFEHDRYQVEMMAGLSEAPPLGATVVVGVGKARSATAFPARVLALVPGA